MLENGDSIKIKINTLTTDMFLELYTSVGWEPPCREQVECASKNTAASFVAYEEEKAIGMVRLIGDGGQSGIDQYERSSRIL